MLGELWKAVQISGTGGQSFFPHTGRRACMPGSRMGARTDEGASVLGVGDGSRDIAPRIEFSCFWGEFLQWRRKYSVPQLEAKQNH